MLRVTRDGRMGMMRLYFCVRRRVGRLCARLIRVRRLRLGLSRSLLRLVICMRRFGGLVTVIRCWLTLIMLII